MYFSTDEQIDQNKILEDPIKYLDNIYNSQNFKNYVKYACLVKKYQRSINRIYLVEGLISFVIALLVYLIFKNILVSFIVFIVIFFVIYLVVHKYIKGEDYNDFYKRTMYKLITNIIANYTINTEKSSVLTNEVFAKDNKTLFDKMSLSNVKAFTNDLSNGEIVDIELLKDTTVKNDDGTTKVSTSKVFDGISISINYSTSFDFLKGAIIEIREDDNFLSNIAEDTMQSIYQSDREFMFNSELLNKSFDCHIKGTNSFGDIDELMEKIHTVIDPLFEEKILFLKDRFNTFNMTITDERINFNVNYNKSFYQKSKSGELFSIENKYKDKYKNVKFPTPTNGNVEDFMYYSIFPITEQLYYIQYFNYFINTQLKRKEILYENSKLYEYNKNIVKRFEENDLLIAKMSNKDFKEKYKELINEIYKESKEITIDI